jgi:hypothetical protein
MVVFCTDNAVGAEVCRETGCDELVALDGAGYTGQCARHRQLARNRAGLCPNCGGKRLRLPVMNDLTVRVPETRFGVSERVWAGSSGDDLMLLLAV